MARKDEATKSILLKLTFLTIVFYVSFYIIVAIASAATGSTVHGNIPFDFTNFSPATASGFVGWVSLVTNYVLTIFYIFRIVRCTSLCWDYAFSISVVHFILSIAVMGLFPANWIWWVTIVIATGIVGGLSEVMTYRLFDLREIKVDH